jgi:Peptidase family M23
LTTAEPACYRGFGLQNWQQIGSLFARLACCAAAAALVAPATAKGWSWPVQGPVLHAFSFGSDPYAGGLHRGIDIGAGAGATVVAPAGGVVSFAGAVPTGGRTVAIQTPDGYSVTLLHLGSVSVGRGAAVAEGDAVGAVGPSGVSEQPVPYVHLGVREAADPQGYLDPLLFLPPLAQPPPPGEPPAPDPVPRTEPAPPPPPAQVVIGPPAAEPPVAEPRRAPARPRGRTSPQP